MNIMYILTRKSKHFEIDKYPIMIKKNCPIIILTGCGINMIIHKITSVGRWNSSDGQDVISKALSYIVSLVSYIKLLTTLCFDNLLSVCPTARYIQGMCRREHAIMFKDNENKFLINLANQFLHGLAHVITNHFVYSKRFMFTFYSGVLIHNN